MLACEALKLLAPACAAFLLFLYYHIPTLPTQKVYQRFASSHPYCVLYDRPPHTGSSSISVALRRCLITHGYHQSKPPKTDLRDKHVGDMIALPHDRVALVSRHLYISPEDLQLLRGRCRRLFYITSASSMRARVWSAVKYSFVGRNYKGELTGDQLNAAVQKAINDTTLEPYLEEYPYVRHTPGRQRRTDAPWGVQPDQRLVPDYVIRRENLEEDLVAVYKQLDCDTSLMETRNVHKVKGPEVVPDIPLAKGDRLFRWLDSLARSKNAAGLERLNEFAASPEDRL